MEDKVMPLYEYRCDDCGLVFEVRQKFSDKPLDACRHCGGRARKLISQTAFTLKGGGWYQQGYSSEKSSATSAGSSNGSDVPKAANG
jgi:putative FmdB family regulatory protein